MVRRSMDESIHIVLPLPHLGGMEKRLAGLFLRLANAGEDVRLVAPRGCVDELAASSEYPGLLEHRLDVLEGEHSFPRLRAHVRELLARAPRGVFHYGLISPLRMHRSRS